MTGQIPLMFYSLFILISLYNLRSVLFKKRSFQMCPLLATRIILRQNNTVSVHSHVPYYSLNCSLTMFYRR